MTTHAQPFFQPPRGACQVVLVRHGQSAAFVEGDPFPLLDGHGDPALSPRGLWQADRVAERLAGEAVGAIYVSPLTRTHQTAAPLADHVGIVPMVERDLREVYLGEFEAGLFRQMWAQDHPAIREWRETGEWGVIPGAESNAELGARTVPVIDRLAAAHRDELIVVVCHGGVIAALLGHAMQVHPFKYSGARNGSFSHLVVAGDRWILRSYNDAAHTGSLTLDHDEPLQ